MIGRLYLEFTNYIWYYESIRMEMIYCAYQWERIEKIIL